MLSSLDARVFASVALLLAIHAPLRAFAQDPNAAGSPSLAAPAPAGDTFRDAAAREFVLRALALRDSASTGLLSYEATAVERMHVGMRVTRRLPLRARTLYHREQMARVYWNGEGAHRVRWIGRREGSPTMGDDWAEHPPFDLDFDVADELGLDDIGVALLFDPRADRLDLFDADFVQPISAPGLRLYHFASGDTTRIRLPALGRTLELVEVVVRPREKMWEAVEGSLWFDRETGALVRAAFRPSGVWDEEERSPGYLDGVPQFLQPAIGTVTTIAIEYALIEGRWWLPWRVVGEGTYDWGHGLVRMPLTIEWTMSDQVVNEAPGPMVTPGPHLVATGRSRRRDLGEETTYLAPAGVDLSRAPELPPPLVQGEPLAFSRAELEPLLRRIEEIGGAPPAKRPPPGRAVLASLRYDRVRGPSVGLSRTLPAGRVQLEPSVRVASAIPDVFTRLTAIRGSISLAAYRDLADASDWNVSDGIGNSLATLLFGVDGGDYYRVDGAALGWSAGRERARVRLEAFRERHRPIERQTSASLATIGGGELRPNLAADRLDIGGVRGELAGQIELGRRSTVVNWRLRGEAAAGDADYGRGLGSVRVTTPLTDRVSSSVEVAAGLASDGTPVQRRFLLGGAGTVRGLRENTLGGPAFWLARAEAGAGLAGLRAVAFADVGWAGEREAFTTSRPSVGVGLGGSMFDGLLRVDVARGVLRAGAWRVYFSIDALL